MRYYVINSEGKEVSFDVTTTQKTLSGAISFNIAAEDKSAHQYYVKTLEDL